MRFALLSAVAWIALTASPAPVSAQDWIASTFPERSFDFGTVARGSKVRHAFKVVNTTNQEIQIVDTRTKCGCTDVRVGARLIPPGTQTVVEATIDTTKFQGYKASGLTLVLDRPAYVEVDLDLTCFIRGDVTLNPGLIDFGVVPRGTSPSLSLTLTYSGAQADWGVVKMNTISPLISSQLRELGRSPGGQVSYQLTATLDKEAPSGFFKDEVTLLTNDPSSPRIPISVNALVQSAVTVSPSILNLGRVQAGKVVQKTVMVRASQPFQVTELKTRDDELSAASTPTGAGPLQTITLTFKAPTKTGPFNSVLEIGTDLTDEPPARLTTFATVVP